MNEKCLRLLFIGNSHTFVNDLPALVAGRFIREGTRCEVTMLAHGGWFLAEHIYEPDVRFNINYGHYDYVVLQEHTTPFDEEGTYADSVRILDEWIKSAGSRTVIYMTWAMQNEEYNQAKISRAHRQIADELGAVLAPVGDLWWNYIHEHPDAQMYYEDGEHASLNGSFFAADCIWQAISDDMESLEDENQGR